MPGIQISNVRPCVYYFLFFVLFSILFLLLLFIYFAIHSHSSNRVNTRKPNKKTGRLYFKLIIMQSQALRIHFTILTKQGQQSCFFFSLFISLAVFRFRCLCRSSYNNLNNSLHWTDTNIRNMRIMGIKWKTQKVQNMEKMK